MHPILKNIVAVTVGLLIGGAVNMAIILLSDSLIAPPEGADLKTMEGLKAAMPLMEPKHFLLPFLAHALGTFVGGFIAARFATNHSLKWGLLIGACFLVGGIANILMLPSPIWFTILDLVVAYLPMGYLGAKLAKR
jgi:large-conductance mechanosensitive channel